MYFEEQGNTAIYFKANRQPLAGKATIFFSIPYFCEPDTFFLKVIMMVFRKKNSTFQKITVGGFEGKVGAVKLV